MRKQTKTLAVLSAAALFAAAAPIMTNTGTYRVLAAQSGWTEEDGRLYYYDEDGYKETNTWKKRNGDWFYLDEEGEIATNQRVDDYFVNDEGHMAKNQWVSAENEISYDSPDSPDGGSWLYFGKDGKIVTAKWMSINGKTYYFDEDGLMQTGLLELDGQTYYLGEEDDGARKTGWILLETITKDTDDEDVWCYFDTEGRMIVNQMDRKIDNGYYTFIDGQMQTGWINVAEAGFVSSSTPSNEAATTDNSATDTVSLNDFRYYDPGKMADAGQAAGTPLKGHRVSAKKKSHFPSSLKTELLTLPRRILLFSPSIPSATASTSAVKCRPGFRA